MGRDTEGMRLWLFDLAHGNLERDQIVRGFIKHYAMHGLTKDHVRDDIVFHTNYGESGVKLACSSLEAALREYVEEQED